MGTSVWWRYEPPADQLVTLDVFGLESVLTVHDAAGTELGCDAGETSPSGYPLLENVGVAGGQTYFVRVSGYDGQDGDFSFDFFTTPALFNDDVADATAIPMPGVYLGTTVTATAEPGEQPASCIPDEFDAMQSAWWRYVVPLDGALDVDLDGSEFNTVLSFRRPDGTEFACNDDDPFNPPIFDNTSRLVNVPVAAGDTVLIRVSGSEANGGFLVGTVRLTLALLPETAVSTVTSGNSLDGRPWERPRATGEVCSIEGTTPFHEATPLTAATTGYYSFSAAWEEHDGCLALYRAPFDPEQACANVIVAECPRFGSPDTTHLPPVVLSADSSYVIVASGLDNAEGGPYTVEALGPAPRQLRSYGGERAGCRSGRGRALGAPPEPDARPGRRHALARSAGARHGRRLRRARPPRGGALRGAARGGGRTR